ncbi:hypothetical protein M2451_003375 [Dysgonomonas sp. PFB1-18]|uniref:hypothetical protein n=1 Tax=unclassified Dysgonomonas TaxID=2630389 RepID=UPI00247445E0|nr:MULTISPECIES: hypothetical protein [unclassified Dysgonomonas]MDH6310535.1 hypothetical protein [Dysgonomonas sp. PF1-14]MDH6340385.1 hypothetical protein [Dysgonomonas sp. PF1-16]MDH6382035.1 hypothetical protein [Dysgonomonas sp. PFB1-18]MDH6399356.1 hypothetical protein [Dysgonomonas sp. PF1-23]
MKKNTIFTAFIGIITLFFITILPTSSIQAQSQKTNPTVGVWKLVYPAIAMTGNQAKVKIITEGHFIWTHTYDNVIVYSLGGTCSFDGETYSEEVQYGVENMRSLIGGKALYKVQFEDGKMHCIGTFGPEKIDEIWERVKKEDTTESLPMLTSYLHQ